MRGWQGAIYLAIGLLIGMVLHEYMHGRVADWRGDHTARNAGRLTLNPIAHIDIWGTVVLPIGLLLLSRGAFTFGYAKPVPVNPYFLKKRSDMMLVALSGPLTNFVLAFAIALIGMIANLAGANPISGYQVSELFVFLYSAAFINLWLGFFNLIPVPPLDGSHVVEYFLPPSARATYDRLAPWGFVIIFPIVWLLGNQIYKLLRPLFVLIGWIMGIPSEYISS